MTKSSGTVDRFAGEYAVIELEDKTFIDVHRDELSIVIKEGDKVFLTDSGKWEKDELATETSRNRIRKLMDDLFE